MKVLVVGAGGREHALAWKIKQSPLVSEVVCTPGNAGMVDVARVEKVAADDGPGLVALCAAEQPGLVVLGPEGPLCAGVADLLRAKGFKVFGPGKDGARLEGSKSFSKDLLEKYRIPTAAARSFDRSGAAKGYLDGCTTWPQVIKADGLASGKGVYIVQDAREGKSVIDALMEEGRHGKAGQRVLIEEFMEGEEASVFVVTDGSTLCILEAVQDHKRVGDGDVGPNTGGMGVFSPVTDLGKRLHKQIESHVLLPTVSALRREGIEYRGVLFVGLMITETGPKVVEYNVRFGDPECQALVRRMKSDLVPLLLATAEGRLEQIEPPTWDARPVVGVVAAAEGYPESPRKGDRISGLEEAGAVDGVLVFHAGTKRVKNPAGELSVATDGGRVLCITAVGDTIDDARERAYRAYDRIHWEGKFCRRDIGRRREARRAAPRG